MLISKKWLSEFIDLPGVSDQELAMRLTLSTVEVEKVINQAASLEGIVVGHVISCAKHPNADRLKVCQVDVGGKNVQIVCGGTNVAEGMNVAVALPGAWVRWHGEGDLVELKETKIRGEASFGMICASVELGLDASGEGEHEIRNLGAINVAPGTPLADVLGQNDVLFEIEHKSLTNRPDLMGHYGMAREISALYGAPLKPYEPPMMASGDNVAISVSVDDAESCPRYMAVAMDGVAVGPSPAWMQARLAACGIRSINNVVDIGNFVMLELGQPMHAFDAKTIAGGAIHVRRAKDAEKIACLDGQTYQLTSDMLVIADAKQALAIAGVMGGAGSAISDGTTSVVFESANFAATSVRKTSTRLGLRSESSARFEKALDRTQCDAALRRAVQLLCELCPSARVASQILDIQAPAPAPVVVSLPEDAPERLLGVAIPTLEVGGILNRLGFKLEKNGRGFSVTVPTWRATKDISITEDVIEEIARIWGYDRIPSALPSFQIQPPEADPLRRLLRDVRTILSHEAHATETYNYAFVSPETLSSLGIAIEPHLKLANPLSRERPYLVRSLIPNLLENVRTNQRVQETVRLFEIARVFHGETIIDDLPLQPHMLGIMYTKKGDTEPFWEGKKMITGLLETLGYAPTLRATASPRSAEIVVQNTVVGTIAEIAPAIGETFGLDHRVVAVEVNLTTLSSMPLGLPGFHPLPLYPAVKRDLAFIVDDRLGFAEIEKVLNAASPLLRHVELFDVYRGKGVEPGKKSLAIHLDLRADDKTLSSEEADGEVKKIVRVIETDFHGTIRS